MGRGIEGLGWTQVEVGRGEVFQGKGFANDFDSLSLIPLD